MSDAAVVLTALAPIVFLVLRRAAVRFAWMR